MPKISIPLFLFPRVMMLYIISLAQQIFLNYEKDKEENDNSVDKNKNNWII